MAVRPYFLVRFIMLTFVAMCTAGIAQATPTNYKPEVVKDINTLKGFNELVPYIIPSPHQEDAGSCLYMTLAGVAEWWLARLNPYASRLSNGPLDLSERFVINASGLKKNTKNVENWKTDSIEILNSAGRGVLNSAYPFTKGWYREDSKGDIFPAPANQNGSSYGVIINWFDNLKSVTRGFVELPKFSRTVLFADPESDPWNVGLNPPGIVEQVKTALVENQAPIQVIYNHEGFWHSVFVVGFDDNRDNRQCGFVQSSIKYFEELARDWIAKADQADSSQKRTEYLKKAKDARSRGNKLKNSFAQTGGCRSQGVFYVRNSEFYGSDGIYDYDSSIKGEETPYAPKVMLFEYEWLEHLANHVVQIGVRQERMGR